MSSSSRGLWACLTCNNRKNKTAHVKCSTCGRARQATRFGLCIDGHLYLAIADTTSFRASVHVLRVSTDPQSSTKLLLPLHGDNLRECVAEVIRGAFHAPHQHPNQEPEGDEQAVDADSELVPSPVTSLFDQVMLNATHTGFDATIRRYGNGPASPNYLRSMERTKAQMASVTAKTAERNALQAQRTLNEKEAEVDSHYAGQHEERRRCSLCELWYPKSQLLGSISFQSIARWRQEHGAPISATDKRFNRARLLDQTPLCLFCTNLFDTDFSGSIEEASTYTSVGIEVDRVVGPEPEIDNRTSKRMMRQVIADGQAARRPLSRIRQHISVNQLKERFLANSDPSVRFFYSAKVEGHLIDQERAGRALRTKYSDVIMVKRARALGQVEAEQAAERMERRGRALGVASLASPDKALASASPRASHLHPEARAAPPTSTSTPTHTPGKARAKRPPPPGSRSTPGKARSRSRSRSRGRGRPTESHLADDSVASGRSHRSNRSARSTKSAKSGRSLASVVSNKSMRSTRSLPGKAGKAGKGYNAGKTGPTSGGRRGKAGGAARANKTWHEQGGDASLDDRMQAAAAGRRQAASTLPARVRQPLVLLVHDSTSASGVARLELKAAARAPLALGRTEGKVSFLVPKRRPSLGAVVPSGSQQSQPGAGGRKASGEAGRGAKLRTGTHERDACGDVYAGDSETEGPRGKATHAKPTKARKPSFDASPAMLHASSYSSSRAPRVPARAAVPETDLPPRRGKVTSRLLHEVQAAYRASDNDPPSLTSGPHSSAKSLAAKARASKGHGAISAPVSPTRRLKSPPPPPERDEEEEDDDDESGYHYPAHGDPLAAQEYPEEFDELEDDGADGSGWREDGGDEGHEDGAPAPHLIPIRTFWGGEELDAGAPPEDAPPEGHGETIESYLWSTDMPMPFTVSQGTNFSPLHSPGAASPSGRGFAERLYSRSPSKRDERRDGLRLLSRGTAPNSRNPSRSSTPQQSAAQRNQLMLLDEGKGRAGGFVEGDYQGSPRDPDAVMRRLKRKGGNKG